MDYHRSYAKRPFCIIFDLVLREVRRLSMIRIVNS